MTQKCLLIVRLSLALLRNPRGTFQLTVSAPRGSGQLLWIPRTLSLYGVSEGTKVSAGVSDESNE